MPEPKWYTKQGSDGKWYKTQANSQEEALAKFAKAAGPSEEYKQGQKEQAESAASSADNASLKHFWQDSPFSMHNIEGEGLKNSLGSAAGAIASIPGSIYHSAADPETAEEAQRFGKGFESKIGPAGRLIDRMAVQPTLNAADWYKKAIQGKIPDPVSQALSVANEGVGVGAGTVVGGRAIDSLMSRLRARSPVDPTAPGSLLGAMTRGKALLDRVDAAAKDIPVNYKPAYEWAQKAIELGKHGFTVPKPITDFVAWVDSRLQPGADKVGSDSFMDRGGELNPLPYQVSRNFEQALGARIPWDSDPGGRMGGVMKKMRESLGQETAVALKPHGLDVPYLKGKAEMAKGYGAKDRFKPIGYVGGKLAGYGAGGAVGHPLIMGHAGGLAGKSNWLVQWSIP